MSECHKSPTFDAQVSADMLFRFFEKNLGVSKMDIFSRFTWSRYSKRINPARADKFRILPTEEMKAACRNYKKNFAKLNKTRSARVEVRNIAGNIAKTRFC